MLSPIFLAAGVVFSLLALVILARSGHFIRALCFTAATGSGALFLVAYLAAFTGVTLAFNWFTLAVAGLSGIPGVIGMLLVKLLLAA